MDSSQPEASGATAGATGGAGRKGGREENGAIRKGAGRELEGHISHSRTPSSASKPPIILKQKNAYSAANASVRKQWLSASAAINIGT